MAGRILQSIALGALALPAHANDRSERIGKPILDVTEVTVRVTCAVDQTPLIRSARSTGAAIPQRGAGVFSVLKRNTETGKLVCEITALNPQIWDDRETKPVGH